MNRRTSALFLLAAWLCASGLALDLAQAAAWSRMFVGYARSESLASAARKTFDPDRPCEMCRAIGKARAAGEHPLQAPEGAAAKKILLYVSQQAPAVHPSPAGRWPSDQPAVGDSREDPVPVPPPRGWLCA